MSDFEHELHDRLAARAEAVPVAEEWDDLLDRVIRKSRRTTRGLAIVTVLAVCFGALGVVVAARDSNSTKAKEKAAPAPRDRVDATNAEVPTVAAPNSGPTYASAGTSSDGANGTLGVSYSPLVKVNGEVVAPSGMWLQSSSGFGIDMAKVFTRTTASGEVIRAYRAKIGASTNNGGPPWWKPADYCFPNGYAQADVSDANIAGNAAAALYAAFRDNAKVGGSVTLMGVPEQAVQWVVIAQGPADAAKLRATFPNGSHDEMQPVDGLAILVGGGPANDTKAKVKVEAVSASGASLGSADLGRFGFDSLAITKNASDSACMPPTTLPAPGKDQPADPAAAKQAVEQTFAAAFHHGNTDAEFAQYFDDSHGFADVMKKLRAGAFKQQVADAQMKLNDVVFLSPTVAAIKYEIDIPNYSTFTNRFTEARLINGQWKLARSGWCNDVSMSGVQCPD